MGGGDNATKELRWWQRRRKLLILCLASAGILVALAVGTIVSWHFSNRVLVPSHGWGWPEDTTVEAISPHRITLERTEETIKPGLNGLNWRGGHAIVGPPISANSNTVTRRLLAVNGYLVPGLEVGIDWGVYAGNPRSALGLPFVKVPIRDELGPMPAWQIPGHRKTWAIFVHGLNGNPQDGLRIASTLHRMGLPSLFISYRDDAGAPSSPDGLHHMGLTEWNDLEAAARYAFSHGASRLVLIGQSMGASIIAQFMEKSPLADRVSALVLDAPALDWKKAIEFNATQMGLPDFSALPVEWAISARIDADWDSLDALQHTEDLRLPILLFQGEKDHWVPIEVSDEFAEMLPQWVTYYRVPEAGHTEAWNMDPPLYDKRVEDFLNVVLKTRGSKTSSTWFSKKIEPDHEGRAPNE